MSSFFLKKIPSYRDHTRIINAMNYKLFTRIIIEAPNANGSGR